MDQQHLPSQDEQQQVALGRVLEILREEENADVLIETTLNYLQSELNYCLIWIGFYDRLDHRLVGKGGIAPTDAQAFLKQGFNLQAGNLLEQVVIQQRSLAIPNLQQESGVGEWRRMAKEWGVQGAIIVPLRCKDRCFGVTLLGSQQWGSIQRPAEKAHLSIVLGGLAATLYRIEVTWQHSAVRHFDQPLFQLLDKLMQVPTVAQRLDRVVSDTQNFVAPTRTNLYWYCPERRYFWHRVGSRQALYSLGELRHTNAGLTVAEASDFYQALVGGRLVAIGMGKSLLTPKSTEHLLVRLQTRSLLAAPIQSQGELLGFLSVEDNRPRIWEEVEYKYVCATAQLVALVVESEELETQLEVTSKDTNLVAEVARAIAHSHDIEVALNNCAELLCQRLNAERCSILQPDSISQFNPIVSVQSPNRRPLTTPLPPLESEDWQWLNQQVEVAVLEDVEENQRLVSWRDSLNQLGVRSLLIYPISPGKWESQNNSSPHSFLVISHGTPRTWNRTERDLVTTVAEPITLLLALSNSFDSARQSLAASETLQTGLSALAHAPLEPTRFEQAWLEYLSNVLGCPLAALISWIPPGDGATVVTTVVTDPHFTLPPDLGISVESDPLIQGALATSHFFSSSVADLPDSTRQWLNSPGIGQVLAIALHQGSIPPTAVLLIADGEERQWQPHLLSALEILTQQFTWLRYYRHRLSQQMRAGEDLQGLNWYKHRCLEMLHQSVRESVSALLKLDAQKQALTAEQESLSSSVVLPKSVVPLLTMRRKQLMHQLETRLAMLTPILKDEQWQLITSPGWISLTPPLKRSLQRVESLYYQRQLVFNVHDFGSFRVYGDRFKLECILYELLQTACLYSQSRSWINLWCRSTTSALNAPLLELAIAECDSLNDCLQAIASSTPDSLPTSNLRICQRILRSWGGEIYFYRLPVNRYLMRVLFPLEMGS
ncbi:MULTISPECIES: GAF domain-containing protein [unclassified Coleofasciculus]|uniref:GAF domain-containing protein n=1 Tax=unclassified Coleofasciculus TaxID=2692782 RepID=UPI0018807AB2|nr:MULTISPECIES: GAF domain-containing protein [unclassified Coleofasciculus]MBE9129203.1 GAF domain-containing protein [Coleofasciculus sp. LEGE 07081]MBE9149707.1 GAF domain-containing protein [Coleofasciculus sp. LEGE 07092]